MLNVSRRCKVGGSCPWYGKFINGMWCAILLLGRITDGIPFLINLLEYLFPIFYLLLIHLFFCRVYVFIYLFSHGGEVSLVWHECMTTKKYQH